MFDKDKFYLGSLCKRGHEYLDSGKTLRNNKSKSCHKCNREYYHRPEVKERKKKERKEAADNLGLQYVKSRIYNGRVNISASEVTPQMIEFKTEQLKLHRLLIDIKRKTKNGIIGAGN